MKPTFGEILPGITYRERPGAYALILNSRGELAVVQTSMGFFLPGGGLDPGESAVAGLTRELREEIGYDLLTAAPAGEATQYHWSEFYQEHFKKIGTFFRATARPAAGGTFQAGHTLAWWPVPRARLELSQEFQRWATGL